MAAFRRSFDFGFGIETDVREYMGRIVISHDLPVSKPIDFEELLHLHARYKNLTLAINVKADSLQSTLNSLLKEYHVKNYFVFDMSVPDAFGYLQFRMKAFTRESEFETTPSFYPKAKGVWMDEFKTHWITLERIKEHLNNSKKVCLVSPELHRRDYLSIWQEYKKMIPKFDTDNLMLCTDFPEEARRFFYA